MTKFYADFAAWLFDAVPFITQTRLLHIIRVVAWFCLWYNINYQRLGAYMVSTGIMGAG